MSERRALVAGGHPATVAAAAEVLVAGGNAYDAIVAAGFAAAVAEPGLTSLGGGGFLLACTAEGEERLVDFFVDTPGRGRQDDAPDPHLTAVTIQFRGAEQVFHAGYGSVAVPGCLAGYLHAHRRWGRIPLREVVRPARHLAEDGVVINAQQGEILGLLEAIFALTPDGAAVFSPDGPPLREGDRFHNPLFAAFLDALAEEKVEGFGASHLAQPLEAAMAEHGGLVTVEDLAAYQVIERDPLVVESHGARLLTNPPPSFGGRLVMQALADTEDSPRWETPEGMAVLADALVRIGTGHREPGPQSTQGTTHTSVADAEGNLAAMTTSNGSCSGVFVPGTGVQLNNIMGEEDLHPDGFHASPPGVRVGSMMAPTVVELPDGDRVALGSGGSERIRSALTLAIGHLCRGSSLGEAVEHPRLHWDGARLQAEPGWDEQLLGSLAARYDVNEWAERNLYFGGVHAVSTSGEVAGDPRRGGSTAIVPLDA
jgi:gamma-glutamyltranspeptidase / glutathione hydrolase